MSARGRSSEGWAELRLLMMAHFSAAVLLQRLLFKRFLGVSSAAALTSSELPANHGAALTVISMYLYVRFLRQEQLT